MKKSSEKHKEIFRFLNDNYLTLPSFVHGYFEGKKQFYMIPSDGCIVIVNEQYLRKMVDEHTGGLLISAHAGNFEMAGNMLERLNTRVNIIMVDSEHEKIREYLSSVTRRNFNIIVIRDDNSHIYEINRAFSEKEIVCIHGDRFVRGSKKMAARFLGGNAFFPTGPFYLALKFGVPVSFVFAMKESKDHYHFYASPPELYEKQGIPGKRDQIILVIIKHYICQLEKIIRKYPSQWFNYYNFWESDEC
jgi:predicted LPLAT superfamily acyltransferase